MGKICIIINVHNAKDWTWKQKGIHPAKSGIYKCNKESSKEIRKINEEKESLTNSVCDRDLLIAKKIHGKKALIRCKEFLDEQKVSNDLICRLLLEYGADIYARKDYFMVCCNGDSWKIPFCSESEKIELWHNNYVISAEGNRYITKRYHKQENWGSTVTAALKYIMCYDYERYHRLTNENDKTI